MATENRNPRVIHGPSATAIGWIPFQPLLGSRLPTSYARHPQTLGLRAMFRTGNRPEPPSDLRGRSTYRGFIDARNFRGALCLSGVKFTDHGDGRDADIEASVDDFIGYTPLRAKGRFGKFDYDLAWHEKGLGKIWTEIEKGPTYATLRRTAEFRIGKWGNVGSALLTGYWAPFAWMSIDYTVWIDGRIRIEFRGSSIPSQSFYVAWRRVRRHSMFTLDRSQITGFLSTGADLPALGRTHFIWSSPTPV